MKNNFQKAMVTGLASIICAGGMSIAPLPDYSNLSYVQEVYAAPLSETPMNATGTTSSNVFLRKGPGTSYAKIILLKKGTSVNIIAKSANGWYKIKYNGSYAYVYKNYVSLKSTTTTETAYESVGTTKNSLNVRKSPSASSTRLGVLGKGAKVNVVAKTSNAWLKIKYNGGYGYVSAQYVTLGSETTEDTTETAYTANGVTKNPVNVRKSAGAGYTKLGSLKKGAKVSIVAKCANGWYKIKYGSGYGYISGQYVTINPSTPSTGDIAYSATGYTKHALNVRKGASTSSNIIGVLKKNAKITIVAKNSTKHWYKIKYNGGYGYVSAYYVTVK